MSETQQCCVSTLSFLTNSIFRESKLLVVSVTNKNDASAASFYWFFENLGEGFTRLP